MGAEQQGLFTQPATQRICIVSPSDFAFLLQDCAHCYYLKVREKLTRPGMVPGVFTAIDRQMRNFFEGQRTERVAPHLPPGVFDCREQWVTSKPLSFPGRGVQLVLRGKLDALVRFDDGSFAVVDFKTSANSEGKADTYSYQLNAYAHALENAPAGKFGVSPVRTLGLLIFEPRVFSSAQAAAQLSGAFSWVPIRHDAERFLRFLGDVAAILDSASPPAPSPDCDWCAYRAKLRTGSA